jgi:ribosome-associated heat shock protein Hsp15
VVTLALDRSVKVVRVEGVCERRGPAAAARALYRDLTKAPAAKG